MTTDPLLAALFDRLPEPGTTFDPFDRARWLTALAACMDIVYGPQPRPPAADTPTDDDTPALGLTPLEVAEVDATIGQTVGIVRLAEGVFIQETRPAPYPAPWLAWPDPLEEAGHGPS